MSRQLQSLALPQQIHISHIGQRDSRYLRKQTADCPVSKQSRAGHLADAGSGKELVGQPCSSERAASQRPHNHCPASWSRHGHQSYTEGAPVAGWLHSRHFSRQGSPKDAQMSTSAATVLLIMLQRTTWPCTTSNVTTQRSGFSHTMFTVLTVDALSAVLGAPQPARAHLAQCTGGRR